MTRHTSAFPSRLPGFTGMFECEDGTLHTLADFGLCRGSGPNPWDHLLHKEEVGAFARPAERACIAQPRSMAYLLTLGPASMPAARKRAYVRDLVALGILCRKRDASDRRRVLYHPHPAEGLTGRTMDLRPFYQFVPPEERAAVLAAAAAKPGEVPGRAVYHANRARKAARAARRRGTP